MNEEQKKLIRRTFQKIDAETFAESFYNHLFSIQPALRLLFPDDFGEQNKKLMLMLEAAVEMLDEPEKLVPFLEESGRRHAIYGAREEHYETVGAALLASLREIFPAEFTAETEAAWTNLYEEMSGIMKQGARRLAGAPEGNQEKNTEENSMKIFNQAKFITGFIFLIMMLSLSALAQTTTFTYQGKLNDGSMAANGNYLLEFKLFDAQTVGTGTQIGTTLTDVPATVVNGIFTVQLDFGANAFNGADRFLEISVRRNASESYTTLAPRQAVSSAPYAIKSKTAETAVTALTAQNSNQLGGINANQYVLTTDTRMSDDRNPLAGSANYIQNTISQQTSSNFNISGEGKANIFSAATQFNIGASRILSIPGTDNTFVGVGTGLNNTTGRGNSFFGTSAGANNTTGISNSFIGAGAGFNNTTGNGNLFVGAGAGFFNISGSSNSFIGTNAGTGNTTGSANSFVGAGAGFSNTEGNNNSFFGLDAGFNNTTGSGNSFVGAGAGRGNQTGINNSFFGLSAGFSNTIGLDNTFVGAQTGNNNTEGSGNSFLGRRVGFNNTTGSSNSFFGTDAGGGNTTGIRNTFVGAGAGFKNTTGSFNSFFGLDAGFNNTVGFNNSFFGVNAGYNNTTGNSNAFFGMNAGINNTVGLDNTFVGTQAGNNNIEGNGNSFFGRRAGFNNTGNSNAFVGADAGGGNTTGSGNSFVGAGVGFMNTTGNDNSFFGLGAGFNNTTGGGNTFVGNSAGQNNTTGSNNTAIGNLANVGANNLTFATAVGAGAVVSTSDTIVLGRTNGADKVRIFGLGAAGSTQLCRNANNEISTCSSSLRYKTNINPFNTGLSIVNRLRPITFDWKDGGMRDLGLGAEDVAAVDENLVIRNAQGEVEGVKYDRLGVVLINAVKEQQAQIEEQKKQIEAQAKQIELLKQLVCSQNPNAAVCK